MSAAGNDGRTRGTLILLLGALSAFAPFATDMYLSGFPAIAADLHSDTAGVQLSLSSFFLGLCVGQLLYGPLTDAWGRRRPLLVGIWIFTVSSAMCLLCRGIDMFIGLRLLQAIGGCAGMIVARAVIQDLMHGPDAARALSTLMVVQGVGPVLAPVLGSYMLLVAGWKGVFAFLTVLGGACLFATLEGLPETLPAQQRLPLRLRSTFGGFATLLRTPGFVLPSLAASFALAAMFAYISGSPFVLMQLHGLSQQQYGWLFALNAGGMIAGAQLNRRLLRRHAPARLMSAATVLMLLAALQLYALQGSTALWPLLGPLFVLIACVPVVAANASALAMDAGRERAGSASSLLGALQFGIAALTSGLVGALHDASARPMITTMLVAVVLSVLVVGVARRYANPR